MHEETSRRTFLQAALAAGAAGVVGSFPSCSSSSQPSGPLVLEFEDTPAFYNRLTGSLNAGTPVEVAFAKHTISRDSRMFALLGKTTNADSVWKSIRELDTEKGRSVLRTALSPELLEHQVVSPDQSKASNNVVEPGTLLLVAVILLILSMTTVATADVVLHGPVSADLTWEFEPPSFHLFFKPSDPHAAA